MYPNDFKNEFLQAVDFLRTTLAKDYIPGDLAIFAEDVSRFPSSGVITLTDQCSDPEDRSITFKYTQKGDNYFSGLEVLSNKYTFKPKKATVITQNVIARTRNIQKDSIIEIEKILGTKGSQDNSIIGRINNIKKIALAPKAWFEIDKSFGLAPLTVKFTSKSQIPGNIGGLITYIWTINEEEDVRYDDPEYIKTFEEAGEYDVTLTITNDFGSNSITFPKAIKVKPTPPEKAIFNIKYTKISTNQSLEIKTPVVDGIVNYEWDLQDDLSHENNHFTIASYKIGGIYDIAIKTTNALGGYRTTRLEKAIDVVEKKNLWYWTINNDVIESYEFGLLSNIFKTRNYYFIGNSTRRYCFKIGDHKALILYDCGGFLHLLEYDGFKETFIEKNKINIGDNWYALANKHDVYIIDGVTKYTINSNYTIKEQKFNSFNFINGAEDILKDNIKSTCWKGYVGYLYGDNCYKTDGTVALPFLNLRKINKPSHPGKIVALEKGIYCFTNSGNFSIYNESSNTWSLKSGDGFVQSFDNNDFYVTSDQINRAYLSYGNNFMKYNETTNKFSLINGKPEGEQWLMEIF